MGISKDTLMPAFNSSANELPKTDFMNYLKNRFGADAARNVLDTFQKIGLPAPEKREEFLDGADGGIVFLNKYGVVIRVETHYLDDFASRIKGNAWILNPLASIDAGRAIVEICPGCHVGKDWKSVNYLQEQLAGQDINFLDGQLCNTGVLPLTTPRFPKGVPVVIDRLAVVGLTQATAPLRPALQEETQEAARAQEALYAPLRHAVDDAWPDKTGPADPQKMKEFWRLCESYVAEGKLVAGWKKSAEGGKTAVAAEAAKHYESRFNPQAKPPSVQPLRKFLDRLFH